MVKLRRRRLSKRTVDSLSVKGKDAVFWDSELQGFGVRVYPTGTKVYIVQTRSGGKSRRFTLGRHGVITADEARHLAAHTIARVKQGEDPDLAPSGWAVDSARSPHRIAAKDRTADPLHHKVISSIVQRHDRAIMTDGHRQEYLVCLVAELLAPEWVSPWTMGHDWAPWDLEHRSGARIQIKQSAARDPWDVGRRVDTRTSWFNIARPDLFMSRDGELIAPPDRLAEIYIFAWHGVTRESVADHRAPEQWTFFVVPASSLRANLRSIGVHDLVEITDAVEFESLVGAVQKILDDL